MNIERLRALTEGENTDEGTTIVAYLREVARSTGTMGDAKALALAETIRGEGYGEDLTLDELDPDSDSFYVGGDCWHVMTQAELDEAVDESLDNYIEDCVLPGLPDIAQRYFNRDAYKRDLSIDGPAHTLGADEWHEGRWAGVWLYVWSR